MRRALLLATLLAAGAAASAASAHQSGCHGAHSCPSDHHTYVWYDSSGAGWDCAEPGAPEYNAAIDTTAITYAGLTWYCHAAGAPSSPLPAPAPLPPPTPTPPSPSPPAGATCFYGSSGRLPDLSCTPGAVFNVGRAQVCTPGYSSGARNVSSAEKDQVYARYGIRHHRPYSYEVDHLVPLELGGANTLANLWPEPYGGRYGARTKDRLENELHHLVCDGSLSLHDAQLGIATDWYRIWIAAGRP